MLKLKAKLLGRTTMCSLLQIVTESLLFSSRLFFIAIARTAQSEEPSTTVARNTSLSTVGNRNSAERRQFSILSSLVVILAIILLSHFLE